MCNYVVTRKENEAEKSVDRESIHYSVLTADQSAVISDQMFGVAWRRLYKKEVIGKIRFPDLQIEDFSFQIKVICSAKEHFSLCCIDSALYYYCQRDDSLIRRFNPSTWLKMVQYFIEILKRTSKPKTEESFCSLYVEGSLHIGMK